MRELVSLVNQSQRQLRRRYPEPQPEDPMEQIMRLYRHVSDEWLVEEYMDYIKGYYEIFEENFQRQHPPLTDAEMLEVMQNLSKSDRLPKNAIRYYMVNCFWEGCDIRIFSKQGSDYIRDAWLRDYFRRPLIDS